MLVKKIGEREKWNNVGRLINCKYVLFGLDTIKLLWKKQTKKAKPKQTTTSKNKAKPESKVNRLTKVSLRGMHWANWNIFVASLSCFRNAFFVCLIFSSSLWVVGVFGRLGYHSNNLFFSCSTKSGASAKEL